MPPRKHRTSSATKSGQQSKRKNRSPNDDHKAAAASQSRRITRAQAIAAADEELRLANLALERDQNRDQVVTEHDEALAARLPASLSRRQTFGTSIRTSLGSLAHRVQDFALKSIRYFISGRAGRPSATGAPVPPAPQVKQEDEINQPEQPQQSQKVKVEPEDQAPFASSPRIKAIKVEEAVTLPAAENAMPAVENAQPAPIIFATEPNPVNPLGVPMPSTDLVAEVLQAPPDPFSEPLLNFPSPQPTPLTDLLSAPRLYEPIEDLPHFVATGLPTNPESPDRMKMIFTNGY